MRAEEIPQPASAQTAEIIAITEALKLSKDKRVNIYTDSAYVSVPYTLMDLRG